MDKIWLNVAELNIGSKEASRLILDECYINGYLIYALVCV